MGLVRNTPTQKATKKKAKKSRKTLDKQRYKKVNREGELSGNPRQQDLAFHSVIGHADLQPFSWIEIAGDEKTAFLEKGKNIVVPTKFSEFALFSKWDRNDVIRQGLIELVIKNERKKKPVAEFTIVEDEYKQRDNKDSRLSKLKVGAKFFVYFGYRAAYTRWGPFQIRYSNIEFSEGTATVKVVGGMGIRSSSITTSEIYSLSEKGSAVKTLSEISGIDIDYSELTEEEIDDINNHSLIGANADATEILYADLGDDLGIEVHPDPENGDTLRLSSPFSLDLIKRGVRPNMITYGYPTSNASAIEVERKFPKRKRRSSSRTVTNTTNKRGAKKEEYKLVYGFVKQNSGEWVRSEETTIAMQEELRLPGAQNQNGEATRQRLEKRYPKDKGYLVYEDREFTLFLQTEGAPRHVKNERFFFIKRKVSSPSKTITDGEVVFTTLESESQFIQSSDLDASLVQYKKENPKVKILSENYEKDNAGKVIRLRLKIQTVKKQSKPVDLKKDKKAVESTQKEFLPTGDKITLTKEAFQKHFGNQKGVIRVKNKGGTGENEYEFQEGTKGYESSQKFFVRSRLRSREQNKTQYIKVVGETDDGLVEVEFYQSGRVKTKPSTDEVTPVSNDTTKNSTPLGKSEKKRITRRRGSISSSGYKQLTIVMKAGDYTHRVGNVIQVVDLHSLYNGYYRISAVTHSISQDGFQTELQARDTKSKDNKSSYKYKTKRATPKSSTPESNRQKVKAKEVAKPKAKVEPITKEEVDKKMAKLKARPKTFGPALL